MRKKNDEIKRFFLRHIYSLNKTYGFGSMAIELDLSFFEENKNDVFFLIVKI